MELPAQLHSLALCPHCSQGISVSLIRTQTYLLGGEIKCDRCHEKLDWWKTILFNLKENFMLTWALSPVGAQHTLFDFPLLPGKVTEIKFSDYGVPVTAKILGVTYTPGGGSLFPIELHGNTPIRHEIPKEIAIYPRPGTETPIETQVTAMVTWVDAGIDDYSWQNLVDSFEYFSTNRFQKCVIPANVAVEAKLSTLVFRYYRMTASEENVKNLLKDGATYSHQLNVLLPSIIQYTNLPQLSDHIRGLLNRLRGMRNEIAHHGALKESLTQDSAAELICAALFGFAYLSNVGIALIDLEHKRKRT